ncbi:MAG: hypothetical protein HY821_04230 [Acidobacteria bacterium]|nr:hypothetical protein [Acidobacteriota bacterium]
MSTAALDAAAGASTGNTGGFGSRNGLASRFGRLGRASSDQNGQVVRSRVSGGVQKVVVPRLNRHHNLAHSTTGHFNALTEESTGFQSVWFHSFQPGPDRKVLDSGKPGANGLAASPEGRYLLCSLIGWKSGDLWLVRAAR